MCLWFTTIVKANMVLPDCYIARNRPSRPKEYNIYDGFYLKPIVECKNSTMGFKVVADVECLYSTMSFTSKTL